MKRRIRITHRLLWLSLFAFVVPGFAGQAQTPRDNEEARDFKFLPTASRHTSRCRKSLEASLPTLKPTKDAAQIVEHQHALARKIADARRNARQGDIFTHEVAERFRKIIRSEFQRTRRPARAPDDPPGRPVQGHCSSACERRVPRRYPVDDHAADFIAQAA